MNRLLVFAGLCAFSLVLSHVACAQQQARPDRNRTQADRAAQILEETAQWHSLFNGSDLKGWQGDTSGYTAESGILVCKKGGKNLYSEDVFTDFAFQFEFKLEESGNNGIGIRVPEGGHPAGAGMEIQILDHHGSRYEGEAVIGGGKPRKVSWLKPWQYHGSIYGIVPARTGYLKPAGEWNQETIIAIDDHVMVILNGAVIVDAFLDQIDPVDGGAHPGMKNRSGHLVLAGHNDRVEFRNLRVADYSPPAKKQMPADDRNAPPEGFVALFNGQNLDGWKGLAHKKANKRRALTGDALEEAQRVADENMRQHWSVVEGVLTYDGKGQSLCTSKDYGDFEMFIDWKIPPGADSGIYLRGTPQVQIWDPWDDRQGGRDDSLTPEQWVKSYKNGRNLGSGGLWNNKQWRNSPLVLADKKPGEWNSFLIRMVGDKVTIWLNGKRIVDRVELENYWDATRRTPLPRADQIELQHHGSELFFRDIFIRELPY